MRLDRLVQMVEKHASERYARKHGFVLPAAMGLSAGASINKGLDVYRNTRSKLDSAEHQTISERDAQKSAGFWPQMPHDASKSSGRGGSGLHMGAESAVGGGLGKGLSDMAALPMSGLAGGMGQVMGKGLDRMFFGREYGERKDPMHMMGTSAVNSLGKGIGDIGAKLLQDMASKAMSSVGAIGQDSARKAILEQLKHEDPILADADDKVLMEAFHTMCRFAPVLSTDKNAVRSFLRQAVMSGNGADYVTIKLLADAERAVTQQDTKR